MSPVIVLLGPPGAGKSTLCRRLLAGNPGLASFGVRRYFTQAVDAGTPLGRRAGPYARRDEWLPDDLVADAVRDQFLVGAFARGVVFEGMPARVSQARLLDDLLDLEQVGPAIVVHLQADDNVCLARAAGRTVCYRCDHGSWPAMGSPEAPSVCSTCGSAITRRPNDTAEAMSARLQQHRRLVKPMLDYYGARALHLDASLSADAVYVNLVTKLPGGAHRQPATR